jgi:hypothetical protein
MYGLFQLFPAFSSFTAKNHNLCVILIALESQKTTYIRSDLMAYVTCYDLRYNCPIDTLSINSITSIMLACLHLANCMCYGPFTQYRKSWSAMLFKYPE